MATLEVALLEEVGVRVVEDGLLIVPMVTINTNVRLALPQTPCLHRLLRRRRSPWSL